MKERKDELIAQLSAASDEKDLLLDFMELYNLDNLMNATVPQLKSFIERVL